MLIEMTEEEFHEHNKKVSDLEDLIHPILLGQKALIVVDTLAGVLGMSILSVADNGLQRAHLREHAIRLMDACINSGGEDNPDLAAERTLN